MASKTPSGRHASRKEFEAAVASMPDVDAVRLRKIAEFRAKALLGFGIGINAGDLLQTAMAQTVAGKRHWRKGVTLVMHLDQTMRSIVGHARRDMKGVSIVDEAAMDFDGLNDRISQQARMPDAERLTAARQQLNQIGRAFADDENVLAVIKGLSDGKKGPEIQEDMGIDGTQYETIITRLRRGIDRDEGWEP